ncbi:hypothetical protein D9O40_05415 [Clostridium autoethanogenum]|uniref:Uncharacterized protein n=1 Tax=Clostridium autoethanogenum TaxID=84023 RepID=A0A3M0SWI3_9CLOT|nr:hypothetical protein [Clostridium autoethanogenum]RMD02740.1 hypothetical protein D9O40_05415 [Clostridium autoethanogenum]
MITVADVITQINTMLTTKFPNTNITFTDNPDGHERPAFYTTILSNASNQLSDRRTQKKIGIKIYYFPTDEHDYLEELCNIQENIDELFCQGFPMQDIYINLDEDGIDYNITDGILQILFYVNYYLERDTEEDNLDYIENIEDEENYK